MEISTILNDTLHTIAQGIFIPTVIGLLIMISIAIVSLGSIIVEIFTERKRLKENIPRLLESFIGKTPFELEDLIMESKILRRQKETLLELLSYRNLPNDVQRSVAQRLIISEENRYEKVVSITDIVTRLAPMLGLMGTLVPLGPGLLALGEGDTKLLSESLLIAFDTTVAGLVSAAVCYVISKVRTTWYEDYMVSLETMMETILEEVRIRNEEKEEYSSGNIANEQGEI
ncbi:MAG: MotA/TolQ/ExbB proton channel family protein [Andreesenia angusta]|nr:MotA/TolQ/ExbB proton channel family protein [Andreesenia angusta]